MESVLSSDILCDDGSDRRSSVLRFGKTAMPLKTIFLILPYLMTSKPVAIRGVGFRSSNDTEGLSPEVMAKVKTLFSMFFLRGNLRIREMISTWSAART